MAVEEETGLPAWLKITLRGNDGDLEALGLALMELGSGGIEEGAGYVAAWFKPEGREEVEARLAALSAASGGGVSWEWDEVEKEDWWESWKKYFHPFRASERLWVRPSWEEADPPEPAMITLIVDPGRAFGTGAHETTRLCLRLIDEALRDKPCGEMLDVGCGSGILTVAARLLGVPKATAIDIDPLAVSATIENAGTNHVAEGVLAARADVRAVNARYPLVVCNILYQIIMGIAPELCRRVEPGGALILSGFLTPELDSVERMFGNLGMTVVKREELGPWGALVLTAGKGDGSVEVNDG